MTECKRNIHRTGRQAFDHRDLQADRRH